MKAVVEDEAVGGTVARRTVSLNAREENSHFANTGCCATTRVGSAAADPLNAAPGYGIIIIIRETADNHKHPS